MLLGILIFFWLLIGGVVYAFEFNQGWFVRLLSAVFWPIALVLIVGWLIIWTLGGQKGLK